MSGFEDELKKQPLRQVPEHWRAQILRNAAAEALKRERPHWWSWLLWPSPKAWGTLAAAWVVLICLNIAVTERDGASEAPETAQIRMAVEQKRKLEAEMEEAAVHLDREDARPRSEATRRGKLA